MLSASSPILSIFLSSILLTESDIPDVEGEARTEETAKRADERSETSQWVMFDQKTQAVHELSGVICVSEHQNLAPHQHVWKVKMTCEEMSFPVKVGQSY